MKLFSFAVSNNDLDNRGKERIRRAKLSSAITLVNRAITAIAGLATIPMIAGYLGAELYGVWLTISTLLTWVSISDFGLTNSLVNALATAIGEKDDQKAREMVSSAFLISFFLSTSFLILGTVIYLMVDWGAFFGIAPSSGNDSINFAVLVSLFIFTLRLATSPLCKIYNAFQEIYLYQIWAVLGNVLSISLLFLSVFLKASLPILLLSYFGSLLVGEILAITNMLGFKRKWLQPKVQYFRWKHANWLLRTGFFFWLAQISTIAMFQTDLIIVTRMFGASEVASYGTSLKFFAYLGTLSLAFVSPLWPAYGEALARGDIDWIDRTFKKSILFNLKWSLPLSIVLFFAVPVLIRNWIGETSEPSISLTLAILISSVVTVVAHCVGMLANGLSEIRVASQVGLVQGLTNVILSIYLGSKIGPAGVAWSTGICLSIFSVGIMGLVTGKRLALLKRANQI